jgi:ParB family chromosome partitioning protein
MKTALGKGLSSLIPEKGKQREILELDIQSIVPSEYQPRRVFKDEALEELAQSIKEKGIIQPIIVKRATVNTYQLIAGERRLRAAKKAELLKMLL